MSTPFAILLGIALIILVSGLVRVLRIWVENRADAEAPMADEALEARLADVEARLRDVLDVMIAINDKVERWEPHGGDGSASGRSAT